MNEWEHDTQQNFNLRQERCDNLKSRKYGLPNFFTCKT
jgi:hypothetical protein